MPVIKNHRNAAARPTRFSAANGMDAPLLQSVLTGQALLVLKRCMYFYIGRGYLY